MRNPYKYQLHIVHPIGGKDQTPESVNATLSALKRRVLAIKLHPAFIIYMMMKFGYNVISEVKEHGFLVMIDDKSHDIRVEVASFVQMYEEAGADILTIHASGGSEMLAGAVAVACKVQIFGVTLLTSLEDYECEAVYTTNPEGTVTRLMGLVENAGCHGSVCAPRDLAWIEKAGIKLDARVRMCPNIRDGNIPIKGDDQNLNRALTPFEAATKDVDLMVIGRWISQSKDSAGEAEKIEADFQAGLEVQFA